MKNECLDFFFACDDMFSFFLFLLFLPSGVYVKDVPCSFFLKQQKKNDCVYAVVCKRQ